MHALKQRFLRWYCGDLTKPYRFGLLPLSWAGLAKRRSASATSEPPNRKGPSVNRPRQPHMLDAATRMKAKSGTARSTLNRPVFEMLS